MTPDTDAVRIAQLEDDNKRLRRLLEQRDASGELRHRLRSTLALLRAIVRKSANSGRDVPGYVSHLEDRLDAIGRAQALADRHGEVALRTLIADELFQYGVFEGERLTLAGPDVRLQPRVAQVFALALHELAINAVEHGALGTDKGRLNIVWHVTAAEAGALLALSWDESGPKSKAVASGHKGFGTEVISRMLPYEFKAETDVTITDDGLKCTVCLMMPGQVGRVSAE